MKDPLTNEMTPSIAASLSFLDAQKALFMALQTLEQLKFTRPIIAEDPLFKLAMFELEAGLMKLRLEKGE